LGLAEYSIFIECIPDKR